jgi:hypothetical protein
MEIKIKSREKGGWKTTGSKALVNFETGDIPPPLTLLLLLMVCVLMCCSVALFSFSQIFSGEGRGGHDAETIITLIYLYYNKEKL